MNNITIDDFIIGTLLGDGCISKLSKGAKNHRWSCGHSEKQLEYLQWKVNFLQEHNLHTGNITKCVSNNSRYKSTCISYHTKSKVNEIFNYYRNLFYIDNKKVFPDIQLNENILTILYMDDGHLLRRPQRTDKAIFNLHSFSNEERDLMCDKLQNFGLKATSRHSNGEIAISSYSMDSFKDIIKPLEMFQYKIMGPV